MGYLCAIIATSYGRIGDNVNAIRFAGEAGKLSAEDNYVQEVLKYCKEKLFWLVEQDRKSDAYAMMQIGLGIWPDDSRLLAYMAGLEIELNKNYELGKSYMKKAFEFNTADLDLLYEIKGALWYDYLNEKGEGLACLEKAVSLNRSSFNLTALASRLIDTECERAEELLEEAVRLAPKDADILCYLAEIALKEKNWARAFELGAKADSLKPDDPHITAALGRAQFNMGEFTEALSYYLKADSLNHPEKAEIYLQTAKCHQKLGDPEKSKAYIEKALAVNPDYPEARELLTQIDTENL